MFRKIIATLTAGLAFSAATVIPAQTATPAQAAALAVCPLLSGHRGAPDNAPENTVPGINEAKARGAKYVEMDVDWDKSNFPRLMHDLTLDRTTNFTGDMSNYWFSDLEKATAADFGPWDDDPKYKGFKPDGLPVTKIPYAWDFFNAVSAPQVAPLLDIRGVPTEAQADKLMDYADRWAGMRQKMIYMGTEASIKAMQSYGYGDLQFAFIEYPANNSVKMGEYLRDTLKADFYALPIKNIRPELVAYYQQFGIKMITWTTDVAADDTTTNWTKAKNAGVYITTTNKLDNYNIWEISQGCA